MKIEKNKIEKLKIIKVNSNNLIVENNENNKGIIHINEISNSYIADLESLYDVGLTVYAVLLKKEGFRRFYSLKRGHSSTNKFVKETGGGCLGLIYLIDKSEIKNDWC